MTSHTDDDTPPCVLILDDEPLIVMDIEFILNYAGYATCTATTVEKAMPLVSEHTISAAILDIDLGHGRTSFDVADYIRDLQIPFLFHSADLKSNRLKLKDYSVGGLSKPCEESEIIAAVEMMIR